MCALLTLRFPFSHYGINGCGDGRSGGGGQATKNNVFSHVKNEIHLFIIHCSRILIKDSHRQPNPNTHTHGAQATAADVVRKYINCMAETGEWSTDNNYFGATVPYTILPTDETKSF